MIASVKGPRAAMAHLLRIVAMLPMGPKRTRRAILASEPCLGSRAVLRIQGTAQIAAEICFNTTPLNLTNRRVVLFV